MSIRVLMIATMLMTIPALAAAAPASDPSSRTSYAESTPPQEANQNVAAVPEPASLLLFGTGLIGVARMVRRRAAASAA